MYNSPNVIILLTLLPAKQTALAGMDDIEDLSLQTGAEENAYAVHSAKPLVVKAGVRAECSAMAKVWVRSYGCSHNFSDGEYMAGQLQSYGYRCSFSS